MHEDVKFTRQDAERLALIEGVVLDLKERLLGNGQPGLIEDHNQRLIKLENWRWWVVGIAVGLGLASGFGLHAIVEGMLK